MKRLLLLVTAIMMLSVQTLSAQGTTKCSGIVIDDNNEPVIGATVAVPGTSIGAATDLDGAFNIKIPASTKEIRISAIGFKNVSVKPGENLRIKLETDAQVLQDVVVTSSLAKTRQTPVAISQVDAAIIDVKLGNQELPEVLKTTPGVWATRDGGAFGDAKINIRGFKAANTATLVNGVPVNDMEWGGVYWSNWSGLGDVTSSMQVQRGLGAAILSTPSIGGTINMITKSLDAKRGGTAWVGLGNDGMTQEGISFSTGMMKNGWAMTVLGSHRQGNGYVQGTDFNAWNYFVNIAKRINDKHQLSLTATGAPQTHYKRSSYDGMTIEGWQNVANYMPKGQMYRYNATYGFDLNGQRRSSQYNFYHKPHISLNHIWQIDHKSSLSTAVYASIASGGGYSGQGRTSDWSNKWYGVSSSTNQLTTDFRKADGTFAYDEVQLMNQASSTGSNMIMAAANNAHEWYGLVSTYKNEFIPNLTFTGGLDLRYYIGRHNYEIVDLYDGEYFIDDRYRGSVNASLNSAAADPNWKYEKLGVGDVINRNYIGHIMQEGIYAQAEYTMLDGDLNFVLAGAVNNNTYWRIEKFYADKDHERSATKNFIAGNIKAGANYNINRHNNVYINGGYLTRAPYFQYGVFAAPTVSNDTNNDPRNEKVGSVELGYEYHSHVFTAQVNAYYTLWMDKSTVKSSTDSNGERWIINMQGVDARHMGVEANFVYKPTQWFELSGMFSWGDYTWNNNAVGYFFNSEGQPLNSKYQVVTDLSEQAYAKINQKGIKVGGSAQTTGALGVSFRPFKGFRIGGDWTMNARNYSDYNLSGSNLNANSTIDVKDPWCIPWGNQLDLFASYNFSVSKDVRCTVTGNVNNLFNHFYVMDAYYDYGNEGTWNNSYRIFYSPGRTFSVRVKLYF